MMLLVDVGNSRIKWMSCERGHFRAHGQASHGAENWTVIATRLWGSLERPTRMLIVNVAGAEAGAGLSDWVWKTWGIKAEFAVSTAAACGIRNAYAEPERLGADRWVAIDRSLGAHPAKLHSGGLRHRSND
ncbi:MAG: type III pantothenate kinase [Synechococcaceae cyanobacterium SM1_2_3]|nr:type III pantothenate kinase [Synechococcaceae cyanobacterium SM1_2_3]